MKYKVVVYYDCMEDSEHVFHTKNEAINEMHRLGLKYRNGWTSSAANKSKIKHLGIELRREMIEFERKHDV